MTNKLILWEPTPAEIIPSSASTLTEITQCAVQLSPKDQRQIARALEAKDFEVGISYLWLKSMAALKRELGSLGIEFIGEMLGRVDVDEDDDVQDLLTDRDALRLAEELGIISKIESLRLRQTQELLSHFAKNDFSDGEDDEMDQAEAARALKTCIKNILGKPHIDVAARFVEFREDLLNNQLNTESPTVTLLCASPYFFKKLSISIILSAIKVSTGASLEIALGNLNTIVPALWDSLRDVEKWQIGHTYRDVYTAGNSVATQGIKQALLKVKGFDFVPENLRSETFVKTADAIIRAHEGMNNFYAENSPVASLEKLGTVIPAPALASCTSALLAVALGNSYGTSFTAAPKANGMLDKYTNDRWEYYLNQCLAGDIRILSKLDDAKPLANWIRIARKHSFDKLSIKDQAISRLVDASVQSSEQNIRRAQNTLLRNYYGKRAK